MIDEGALQRMSFHFCPFETKALSPVKKPLCSRRVSKVSAQLLRTANKNLMVALIFHADKPLFCMTLTLSQHVCSSTHCYRKMKFAKNDKASIYSHSVERVILRKNAIFQTYFLRSKGRSECKRNAQKHP